jgi:XTP/dITP diphosphohydrolase
VSHSAAGGRWVLATGNRGKLTELRELLVGSGIELVAQDELGVASPEETGGTFVENAILKARYASLQTGLPALADDSGLVVEALMGAPGIRSARFAGAGCSDTDNVAKLLSELREVPRERRGAYFHCVIVALRSAADPAPEIAQGRWHGRIAMEPSGPGGFGYDPVFFDPRLDTMASELPLAAKNRVSHRGQALTALVRQLRAGSEPT